MANVHSAKDRRDEARSARKSARSQGGARPPGALGPTGEQRLLTLLAQSHMHDLFEQRVKRLKAQVTGRLVKTLRAARFTS
jgi:hypothetical protein